jgi:hypothetical protein
MMLENSIAMTQRTLWNSKALPYFRETSISLFRVCGENKLNRYNQGDLVFADARPLGGPNLDADLSIRGLCQEWLDQLDPVLGFGFWVSLFIVTFRHATVKCKIFILVHT